MPNKSPLATGAEAEKQLKGFIAKFEPKHQRLIREVRKAVRARFATAHELAYDTITTSLSSDTARANGRLTRSFR